MNFRVHKPVPGGKDQIGGAIFLFSKGESSTKNRIERSKTIAGLTYTHCNRFLKVVGDPDPTLADWSLFLRAAGLWGDRGQYRVMRTRGDMFRYAIAYALMGARKLVCGLHQGLSEEERYRVADDVVHRLKQHGDPWRSSEPPATGKGFSTPPNQPI